MVSTVEDLVRKAQIDQNKEMIQELSNDKTLNNNVSAALKYIDASVEYNGLDVTKLDQGKGEFKNHIDVELMSKYGVSSVSINEQEWKVKGIENNYSGDIAESKDMYKAIEQSQNILEAQIDKLKDQINNYEPVPLMVDNFSEHREDAANFEKLNDQLSKLEKELELKNKEVTNPELTANQVLKEASANFHQDQIKELKSLISDFEKQGAEVSGQYDPEKLQVNLTVKDADSKDMLFTLETAKMSSEILVSGKQTNEEFVYTFKEPMDEIERQLIVDQVNIEKREAIQNRDLGITTPIAEIENSTDLKIKLEDTPELVVNNDFNADKSINDMYEKYNADLIRMGALDSFNASGSNDANKTYEQLKEIAERHGLDIEFSKGAYPDSVKAEFMRDGENTNISAQIHLDGKAAIAYDESIYILSNKPDEINYETSRLINEYETDRSFNYIEYIPEREMVQDENIPASDVNLSQYSQDYSYTQESITTTQPIAAQEPIPDPNLEAKTPESVVRNDTPMQDTTSQVESTTVNTDRAIESNTRVDTPEMASSGANTEKTGYSLPASVAMDYVHTPADSSFKTSKFYEKNNPLSVAFEDKGKALSSGRDDAKTIQSMVAIAKQKNWGNIQVKGSEEFKRQAWIEAQAHGIQVKGYSPTERDKVALQVRQEELSRNQIHHVPEREKQQSKTEVTKSTEVKHETKVNHREDLEAKRIASRRMLEHMLKDRPEDDKKRILGEFDKKANDPKALEKLVAPVIKQAKEMEHSQSGNKERSR